MEPYNVKVITFPDCSRQFRVYKHVVEYRFGPRHRYQNPFNDDLADEILCDFSEHFDHVHTVSFQRTQQKIYDYARCNDWDYFVTFTFSKEKVNRYDYDACVKLLSKWLNNLRRGSPSLSYLVVPEQHKDGAWHFHGLVAGLADSEIVWSGRFVCQKIRGPGRTRFRMTDRKIYKIGSYRLGWMTATEIVDKKRVVKYITKYVTKDMMSGLFGRKRYWVSRNLLLPTSETYMLDLIDRDILCRELLEDCTYHVESQSNDFTTQKVDIFDL